MCSWGVYLQGLCSQSCLMLLSDLRSHEAVSMLVYCGTCYIVALSKVPAKRKQRLMQVKRPYIRKVFTCKTCVSGHA